MDAIGKKIAKAREAAGMNQSELARALQVKHQAVQKWESGGSPRNARLTEIAQALGVSVAYLVSDAEQASEVLPEVAFLSVPMLANDASMGPGSDDHAEDVMTGVIRLTDHFVREYVRPSRPESLRFIHAYGDSMAPTLNSGDVLLVDTGAKDIDIDGIYVLRAHGRLFVKRGASAWTTSSRSAATTQPTRPSRCSTVTTR